jgi:DNA-binding winged helix-turn-helix (wHTH) protein/Tol biopolymer transport system component
MTANKSFVFYFGDVEVREREFCIVKAGEVLAVEPKAFRVLLYLLRHPQKLVTKEQLLNAVWGDAIVTENSLTRSIMKLRRALEDDLQEPRYIATVATVGYRFVSPVKVSEAVSGGPEAPVERNGSTDGEFGVPPGNGIVAAVKVQPSGQIGNGVAVGMIAAKAPVGRLNRFEPGWLLAAGVVAIALAALSWYLRRPVPPMRVSEYTQITHDGQRKALIGTDGTRLYFNVDSAADFPAEVLITGGNTVPIQVALPNPWAYDVSPDGTALLVTSYDRDRGSLWSVGTEGNSVHHLADGNIRGSAWSPDGRSVAYSTSNGDIHVMRSDGAGAQVLGTVPNRTENAVFERISWSPDRRTIRFDRNNRIFEISLNGSGPHPFLPEWRPSSWQCCGRWTADGSFYLFLVWDNPQNAYPLIPPFQIWALDERRGIFRRKPAEPYQLTSGPTRWGRPVPAKGGTIFARGINLNGELVRLDPESHQVVPYLGGISAESVTFSPDGKFVAYVTYPEGILWRADRDGNNRTQLTDPPLYPALPHWSPDGAEIVFTAADQDGTTRSYLVSSQGGDLRPVLPGYKPEMGNPNWSPDGSKLVFDSWEGERDNSKHVTRILDLASRQVTTLPGDKWSARWSPTGRFLAGLSHDTSELTLFDFETQRWSGLLNGRAGFPSWSHDGQFIYFLRFSKDSGVYRIRPTGGQAERISDLKGFHHTGYFSFWMGLDPDDNPLLIRDLGGDDLYSLSLEEK